MPRGQQLRAWAWGAGRHLCVGPGGSLHSGQPWAAPALHCMLLGSGHWGRGVARTRQCGQPLGGPRPPGPTGAVCAQPECGPAAADSALHMALGADELSQIPSSTCLCVWRVCASEKGRLVTWPSLMEEAGAAPRSSRNFSS